MSFHKRFSMLRRAMKKAGWRIVSGKEYVKYRDQCRYDPEKSPHFPKHLEFIAHCDWYPVERREGVYHRIRRFITLREDWKNQIKYYPAHQEWGKVVKTALGALASGNITFSVRLPEESEDYEQVQELDNLYEEPCGPEE